MPSVDKKVVVIHGVFMLKGAYTTHGQVVSDPEDMGFCLTNHRDKCVPSVHAFDEKGEDLGVAQPKAATTQDEDHE